MTGTSVYATVGTIEAVDWLRELLKDSEFQEIIKIERKPVDMRDGRQCWDLRIWTTRLL